MNEHEPATVSPSNEKIFPHIEKIKEDLYLIELNEGKKIHILGTAHVSKKSAQEVVDLIEELSPDEVAVELDEERFKVLKNKNSFEKLDIIKIIKKGQTFLFISHLLLSSFQKKLSDKTGTLPGQEFRQAVELCEKKNTKLALVDRKIGITLKRAWRLAGIWGQMKIIAAILFASNEKIDEKTIEDLKKEDELTALIDEIAVEMPIVKQVLIDERDTFISGKLQLIQGKNVLAIVGAGHLPGILKKIKNPISNDELVKIEQIPSSGLFWKIFPYIIPIIVIGLMINGFKNGIGGVIIGEWVLINGTLSALGCLLALAHPLTILAGFIAAPITSLIPVIGAGFVTALVQVFLYRPRVIDFINMHENASQVKKWWKNRLIKVLMVFVFSSLGSSIGTFIAGTSIISRLMAIK